MVEPVREVEGPRAPKVSCIVPTHLRVDALDRALDSIARQEFTPCEVLVVDDAADVQTRNLVQGRAANFPCKLGYIDNSDNPGACNSRNKGAAEAAGDFLAFLDDDDVWLPAFLACCVATIIDRNTDFAITYVARRYPDGTVKTLKTSSDLTGHTVLKERVCMTGSSFMIRSGAFASAGGFDPDVPVFNDWDFFIRLLRDGLTYAVVPKALAQWNEHDGLRITTGTLRRADGIDRFLRCYGSGMSGDVRSYYMRLSYGIRKSFAQSRFRRAKLTAEMLLKGGVPMILFLVGERIGWSKSPN